MATYAWLVEIDHDTGQTSQSLVGTVGPHDAFLTTAEEIREYAETHPNNVLRWRTADADSGQLYHEGLLVGEFEGHEPLYDLSYVLCGADQMEYQNVVGDWQLWYDD